MKLRKDSNKNGVPDIVEFITTYSLVVLGVYMLLFQPIGDGLKQWIFVSIAVLTGNRDRLKRGDKY